jgi:tRNA(Ile)-lysidine synthase
MAYLSAMESRFLQQLAQFGITPGRRVLVAVSGGPDSVVLLDLLTRSRPSHALDLVVVHADHGIHPESDRVSQDVERLASSYGLRCVTLHLGLGEGTTETDAREARYAALEDARQREGAEHILTAHHADDQAETVLLRVLHGSGPAGLAAMAARRGSVLRPLLAFSRAEIEQYRQQHQLAAWDDPANRDPRHLRSWLRTLVLPVIRQRLSDVDRALLRVADQAATEREAWDRVLDQLPHLDWRQETAGCSVAASVLGGYDSALAPVLLRAIGRRAGCRLGEQQSRRAIEFIRGGESGTRFELGNGWEVEIVFDRVHLVTPAVETNDLLSHPLVLDGDAGDGAVGRWRLFWRRESAPGTQQRDDLTAWFIPETLAIRSWEPGDRIHPLGGPGRRLVVRCLQDARVPRRMREGYPMVVDRAGEIVWVPGVCRSNRLVPPAGAEALRVDAQVV